LEPIEGIRDIPENDEPYCRVSHERLIATPGEQKTDAAAKAGMSSDLYRKHLLSAGSPEQKTGGGTCFVLPTA
jgi:hypothetical protein